MSRFDDFMITLQKFGMERFNKYYGTYRGLVLSGTDPEKRGRILVRVMAVSTKVLSVWVDPCFHGAGTNRGMFWPPEVGDSVGIKYENGNPNRPMFYVGGWYGVGELPAEFVYSNGRPERRGFVTRGGHALVFNDEPGKQRVRLLWHKPSEGDPALDDASKTADRTSGDNAFLSFEDDGTVQVVNGAGSMINMDVENGLIALIDENGNSITMDSDGIKLISKDGNVVEVNKDGVSVIGKSTVSITAASVNVLGGGVYLGQGASLSAVLGEPLVAWLNSHVHPTGVGPSGPAVPLATTALLSKVVKVI